MHDVAHERLAGVLDQSPFFVSDVWHGSQVMAKADTESRHAFGFGPSDQLLEDRAIGRIALNTSVSEQATWDEPDLFDDGMAVRTATVTEVCAQCKVLCVMVKELVGYICTLSGEMLRWAGGKGNNLGGKQREELTDLVEKQLQELRQSEPAELLRLVWPSNRMSEAIERYCNSLVNQLQAFQHAELASTEPHSQTGAALLRAIASLDGGADGVGVSPRLDPRSSTAERQIQELSDASPVADQLFRRVLRKLQVERLAWAEEKRALATQRNALLKEMHSLQEKRAIGTWEEQMFQFEDLADANRQDRQDGKHGLSVQVVGSIVECYSNSRGGWLLARLDAVRSDGQNILNGGIAAPSESIRPSLGGSSQLLDSIPKHEASIGSAQGNYVLKQAEASPGAYWLRSCKKPFPEMLHVVAPMIKEACSGHYDLVLETERLGYPAWKQRGGVYWLFSGIGGHWFIGNALNQRRLGVESDFEVSTGFISSSNGHEGSMPDELFADDWCYFNGVSWVSDATIAVVSVPFTDKSREKIIGERYAQAPVAINIEVVGQSMACSGQYVLVPDKAPNNYPVWKQRGANYWLFGSIAGQWIIGSEREFEEAFLCESGVVATWAAHQGVMPHKIAAGGWMVLEDDHWQRHPKIKIEVADLTSPLIMVAKEVDVDLGFDVNGLPPRRVFVKGIHAGAPWPLRYGLLVGDEIVSVNGQDVTELTDICFTTSMTSRPLQLAITRSKLLPESEISIPNTLYVEAPQATQLCSGVYELVQGVATNGQPLWRQDGGEHWIFSSLGGRWYIGDAHEKETDFKSDTAIISSWQQHKGTMPNELPLGSYLRLGGDAWLQDSSITIVSGAEAGLAKGVFAVLLRVSNKGFKTVGSPPAPVHIRSVLPGSWAADQLMPGDELLKVKGLFTTSIPQEDLTATLSKERPLLLTIFRGDVRQFEVTTPESVGQVGFRTSGSAPDPIHVSALDPEGWAVQNGVAHGDELAKVNGERVSGLTQRELMDNLMARPLRLLLRRGGGRLATRAIVRDHTSKSYV